MATVAMAERRTDPGGQGWGASGTARICLAFSLSLFACQSEPEPTPRIVILGSSSAAGVGPSSFENGWVEHYRALLAITKPEVDIRNLSFPGFNTYSVQPIGFEPPPDRPMTVVSSSITAAVRFEPQVIIVNLPSNDQAEGYSRAEQEANLDRGRDTAVEAGIAVWITTTQPRNFEEAAELASLIEMRDVITTRYGPNVFDFWTGLAGADGRILPAYDSGDGVHLNDAAHEILAARVVAANLP